MSDRSATPEAIIAEAARLHDAGQGEAARAPLQQAVLRHPGHAALHNALGVAHATAGSFESAWHCYMAAARIAPSEGGIWTNAGNAATRLGRHATALACHRQALQINPRDGGFHYNLGIALASAGHHAEAIAAFGQALDLAPGHRMARWDRALSLLSLGNLPAGFADYESRLSSALVPPRPVSGQKWDGDAYAGRHLLILSEQGLGDAIWVSRYLARAKALGGRLSVECHRPLIRLIAHQGLADSIIPHGEALPEADLHLHQGSLPGLFTDTLARAPAPPYLSLHPSWRAKAQHVLGPRSHELRVGIVWSGSAAFARNDQRAQPLSRFVAAFTLPGIKLYSLQLGPQHAELAEAQTPDVTDLAPHIADLADTAGLVAELDLIIMTDTAVAHLAGALDKPVWLILGPNPHFLWPNQDSPWYPSIKTFKCRHDGDWGHAFDQASAALLTVGWERQALGVAVTR